MCCMCLLVGGLPKSKCTWSALAGGFISRAAGFIHLWQRTVLSSFGYWAQNMDIQLGPVKQIRIHAVEGRGSPTFTRICKSAINRPLTMATVFVGYRRTLLVSITQNQHSSYSMSSSRNSDESGHVGVWLFHDNAPAHKSLVAQQALCNCEFA